MTVNDTIGEVLADARHEDGCLIMDSQLLNTGYPWVGRLEGGPPITARRFMFAWSIDTNPDHLPKGLHLRNTCGRKTCIEPDHIINPLTTKETHS